MLGGIAAAIPLRPVLQLAPDIAVKLFLGQVRRFPQGTDAAMFNVSPMRSRVADTECKPNRWYPIHRRVEVRRWRSRRFRGRKIEHRTSKHQNKGMKKLSLIKRYDGLTSSCNRQKTSFFNFQARTLLHPEKTDDRREISLSYRGKRSPSSSVLPVDLSLGISSG